MKKLKLNDEVIVISGRDKGRKGKILKVLANKVIVSGINMIKRHVRKEGIVEKEAALDASNVAIFNPSSGKADRVGFKFNGSGEKVRIFKSTKEVIV